MKLLAILTGPNSTPACLDAALLAVQAFPGASIEALHVIVDPAHIVAAAEEIDFQKLREVTEGTAQERTEKVHTAFTAWQEHGDDNVHWRTQVGPEEATVKDAAQAADIVALTLGMGKSMDAGDAFHSVVFETGRPVIVAPVNWRRGARTRFAHIAIGLSDSEQVRHAIEGAAPWLRGAERLTGIHVGEHDDIALGHARLLAQEGVDPEMRVVARRDDMDLGSQIVAEANAVGADLLVSGAYRHNEFVEWIMGGTTRHMLHAANLPLLLSH
jgi:nucleotide-binding universal stress UspA family protein